ncbi:MAG: DMT family transporter [Thaumarchaeota archaeon]|nr:MAG: DMT family transporter [Nitrososphaerota archaeon]TLX83402.1 MAG: DMT family transporter [Nitrososphaerota archaeon]
MGITSGIGRIKFTSPATLGYLVVIIAATLEALRQILSKALLVPTDQITTELNPVTISFFIFIINGLFFSPFARKSGSIRKIRKKDLFFLSLIGMAEGSALITYFFGLRDSTAINASVLNNGEIMFSILLALIIFRERLQKMERIPFSMIIIGMVVLPIGYDFYNNGITMTKLVFGDILLLLAGFFWALDINISNHVSDRLGSQRITQLASFVAGLFALSLILIFQIPFKIDFIHMPTIAIIGIVSIGMSTALFITGLKLIGAVRTILIYSINSAFGVVLSGVFLHETVTMASILSVSIAFLGLYLIRNRLGSKEIMNRSK